jgi:hypothetical protein
VTGPIEQKAESPGSEMAGLSAFPPGELPKFGIHPARLSREHYLQFASLGTACLEI